MYYTESQNCLKNRKTSKQNIKHQKNLKTKTHTRAATLPLNGWDFFHILRFALVGDLVTLPQFPLHWF